MGGQGSGKSTLTRMIVKGCNGPAARVEWEEARGVSNDEIRERHAAFALVCVEACELEARHGDLKPGDWLLRIGGDSLGPSGR